MRTIENLNSLLPGMGPEDGLIDMLRYFEMGTTFLELNTNYGEWDFKRVMGENLGQAVILCGITCMWFDYSTPSNIVFGFVAASVGIPLEESFAAGGYLELTNEDGQPGPFWPNLFENEEDANAVQLGYHLFETYGHDLTLQAFQNELSVDVMGSLQGPPGNSPIPYSPYSQPNSYNAGSFDCTAQRGCYAR